MDGVRRNSSNRRRESLMTVSILPALLLLGSWVVSVLVFRLFMSLFVDFKVEMPHLTLWAITATKGFWLWVLTAASSMTAVLLALRFRVGFYFALIVCAICDLLFWAGAMPYFALVNGLSGGDGARVLFPRSSR